MKRKRALRERNLPGITGWDFDRMIAGGMASRSQPIMQGDRVLETSLMPKKTRYSSFPQWGFSAYYKHAFVLFPLNQHKV